MEEDVVSPLVSPESTVDEHTLTCEDEPQPPEPAVRGGGSDSGVDAGAPGVHDGYASGLESLVGGAASTSCESSLLSFSGDLDTAVAGLEEPVRTASGGSGGSGRGRRTTTPGSAPSSRHSPAQQQQSRGANSTTAAAAARRADHKGGAQSSKSSSSSNSARVPRRTEARSASRGRTPPTDDGRWPSVSIKPTRRSPASQTPPSSMTTSTSGLERRSQRAVSHTPPEPRSSTLDKYGTLPRRTRLTVTLPPAAPEAPAASSKSVGRELSLNRAASLRRQRTTATTSGSSSGYRSDAEDAAGSSVRSKSLTRSLPPYPRRRRAHNMRDAAAQTTSVPSNRDQHGSTEELEARLERLGLENARAQASLVLAEKALAAERAQREALQLEADRTARRVGALLRGGETPEGPPRGDWLPELESRLSATADVAARHQKELIKAQRHNRNLTEEVEKARGATQTVRQQLADVEEEAAELQEFLVAEKNTLAESLREAEDKVANLMKQLERKEQDIERQQEECRHLVRLSEQRRQEAVALQAQVSSTERLLVSQGGCTTAASVALSELCSRLEALLPQLNSPKEEVEIFLNEAYAPSSVETSPENKRKTNSPAKTSETVSSTQDEEEVLSQVRSPEGLHAVEVDEDEEVSPGKLAGSASLHDLTQAILACHSTCLQQQQEGTDEQNVSLADQASELDQLVSKLMGTFHSLLLQREHSIAELNRCKQKFDSEHSALEEANSQLEEQTRRMRQLEAAQRLHAQQIEEFEALRARLTEKERQLAEAKSKATASRQLVAANWVKAAEEIRGQYEVIDRALEVFHVEQTLVSQSPALSQLQRELEDTNFRCVTLPLPEELQASPQHQPPQAQDSMPLLQTLHLPETVNGTA